MWPFMALAAFLQVLQLLEILPTKFSSDFIVQTDEASWLEAQNMCNDRGAKIELALVNETHPNYKETLKSILETITNLDQKPEVPLRDNLGFWVGNSQDHCNPPGTVELTSTTTQMPTEITTSTTTQSPTEITTSTTTQMPTEITTSTTTQMPTEITTSTSIISSSTTASITTPTVTPTTAGTTTTMKPMCEFCNYLELMVDKDASPKRLKRKGVVIFLTVYKVVPKLEKCDTMLFSVCEKLF